MRPSPTPLPRMRRWCGKLSKRQRAEETSQTCRPIRAKRELGPYSSDVGPMAQAIVAKPDFANPRTCRHWAPHYEVGKQASIEQNNVRRNAANRSRDCQLISLYRQL